MIGKRTYGPPNGGFGLEELVTDELNKTKLSATHLGGGGYPDIRAIDPITSKTYFPEVKGSKSMDGSDQRYFYYSTSRKITTDGGHVVIDTFVKEVGRECWEIVNCRWGDAYYLMMNWKSEYSATKTDVMNLSRPTLLEYY